MSSVPIGENNALGGHDWQSDLLAVEKVSVPHSMQLVDPVRFEANPAGQLLHSPGPS